MATLEVTVNGEGRPHVVSVSVALEDGELVTGAGRTTAANVGGRPDVTLLWPPSAEGYSLIVDGPAVVRDSSAGAVVAVAPNRAVLHRTVTAPGAACGA